MLIEITLLEKETVRNEGSASYSKDKMLIYGSMLNTASFFCIVGLIQTYSIKADRS